MGNHIHLLLKEGKEPLELIFKRIGARFVFWYNWKYKRSGHLFEDRFKSEPVEDDAYFLAVLRYIYQNPVKANRCSKQEDYPWSSYRTLGSDSAIADHDRVLQLLPAEQLRVFIEAPFDEHFLELTPDTRLTDREAAAMIKKTCRIQNPSALQGILSGKQAAYLKTLQKKGCSIRQLARLTGISKGRVERVLK